MAQGGYSRTVFLTKFYSGDPREKTEMGREIYVWKRENVQTGISGEPTNTAMNFRVPFNAEHFSNRWGSTSFSRRILLHLVSNLLIYYFYLAVANPHSEISFIRKNAERLPFTPPYPSPTHHEIQSQSSSNPTGSHKYIYIISENSHAITPNSPIIYKWDWSEILKFWPDIFFV